VAGANLVDRRIDEKSSLAWRAGEGGTPKIDAPSGSIRAFIRGSFQ